MIVGGLFCWMYLAEPEAHITPDYGQVDLQPILQKEHFSQEDYQLLWEQTGLSKTAIDQIPSVEQNGHDFPESDIFSHAAVSAPPAHRHGFSSLHPPEYTPHPLDEFFYSNLRSIAHSSHLHPDRDGKSVV